MDARQFVQAVRVAVCDCAAKGTLDVLQKPPGRHPDAQTVVCSEWFHLLESQDREIVTHIIELAAKQATYNFLLALDGLVALEPAGAKGTLELFFEKGETRVRLNDEREQQLSSLFKERT